MFTILKKGDFVYKIQKQDQSDGIWRDATKPHESGADVTIICQYVEPNYDVRYNDKSFLFFKWSEKIVRRFDCDASQRKRALEITKSLPSDNLRIAKYSLNEETGDLVLEEVIWRDGKWL